MSFESSNFSNKNKKGLETDERMSTNSVPFKGLQAVGARIAEWAGPREAAHKTESAVQTTTLDNFNFELLATILSEIARKSGVDDIQILPRERIFLYSKQKKEASKPTPGLPTGLAGQFDYFSRSILIDTDAIEGFSRKGIPEDIAFIRVLIHEEVHRSFYNSPEANGVQRDSNIGMNEGLVELVAQRAFREYCARSGTLGKEKADIQNEVFVTGHDYSPYVRFIQKFTQAVAQVAGVSAEIVENALIRSAFRGERLDNDEIKAALDGAFGENFAPRMLSDPALLSSDALSVHSLNLMRADQSDEAMKFEQIKNLRYLRDLLGV